MQITVKDRQSLLDIAVLALGSVVGVFALAQRNGIAITATLTDGQQLNYELEDVVNHSVRSAYALERISPATDIDTPEYKELLYATGTKRPLIMRPPLVKSTEDFLVVDKIDEVLGQIAHKIPVKTESKQQYTRIFDDPFSEVFS